MSQMLLILILSDRLVKGEKFLCLESRRIAYIFSTRCPFVMGLGQKGRIFNAQIGCVTKSKLNLTDM